ENREAIDIIFMPDESYDEPEFIISDKRIFDSIKRDKKFYIPIIPEPPQDNLYISKFIGKIALEALAKRVITAEGWQDDFVENDSLDETRNFVRYGKGYALWPYYIRKIYGENKISYDKKSDKLLETLNEYDFLFPDTPSISGE